MVAFGQWSAVVLRGVSLELTAVIPKTASYRSERKLDMTAEHALGCRVRRRVYATSQSSDRSNKRGANKYGIRRAKRRYRKLAERRREVRDSGRSEGTVEPRARTNECATGRRKEDCNKGARQDCGSGLHRCGRAVAMAGDARVRVKALCTPSVSR